MFGYGDSNRYERHPPGPSMHFQQLSPNACNQFGLGQVDLVPMGGASPAVRRQCPLGPVHTPLDWQRALGRTHWQSFPERASLVARVAIGVTLR